MITGDLYNTKTKTSDLRWATYPENTVSGGIRSSYNISSIDNIADQLCLLVDDINQGSAWREGNGALRLHHIREMGTFFNAASRSSNLRPPTHINTSILNNNTFLISQSNNKYIAYVVLIYIF